MGSFFRDVNHHLHPSITSNTTTTNAAIKIPIFESFNEQPETFTIKIPKPEPLDEPPQAQFIQTQVQNHFQTPHFHRTIHPTFTFPPPNATQIPHIPSSSTVQPNAYAEFHRISADSFAGRMQRYDDVSILESLEPIIPFNDDPIQLSNDVVSVLESSQAIIPFNNETTQLPNAVVSPSPRPRKNNQRSGELVRVTDVGPQDENHFRGRMRRTRMTFNALRQKEISEDERNPDVRRTRVDLKAAALMMSGGLWLNRDKRIVGAIPGVSIGDIFLWRMEMCVVGLHGQVQAGIDYLTASQSSNGQPIATSVIVSGGYEDDEDAGDVVIYTGQGGQDKHGRQCVHQRLEGGNLALERSMYYEIEVRVIRGIKYEGSASGKVYVYDGLYKIVDSWFDIGKSGFGVFKFRLVRIENQPEMGSVVLKFAEELRNCPLTARPIGYVSLDISKKEENVPVLLFNDVDSERDPDYFDYLRTSVFPPYVYGNVGNGAGCDCVGGCVDNCFCSMRNGGEFPYDNNGILLRGKPIIFECGPHCQCPQTCRNRVTQKGVRNRFEVFRSRETSWGVRSLDLIQAGVFICEFAGVVLTRELAQIFAMNGDNLVYPSRFSDRWAEWGDLSQRFPDYVRPSYPSVPPLDFAMDVSRMRNVACYMSHSSTPNAFVQLVLYDHNNVSFPHLMVFALENIPPLREISIDYGVADEWTGKLAICN